MIYRPVRERDPDSIIKNIDLGLGSTGLMKFHFYPSAQEIIAVSHH